MSALDMTLQAVLSTSLDPAIAMRDDGSISAWNSVAEKTFGWTFAEVNGRQLSEVIIPPELRSRHQRGLKRYLETGNAKVLGKHIEVTALDREGRRFHAELSTTELREDGERIFVGFIRDISARKEADQKLRDVTERLELAVRTHSIGVFDTDVMTDRVMWNEELERIYGYLPGKFETTLAAWRRHVFPKDLMRINAQFSKAIEAHSSEVSYSYRMTRCDGAVRHIEASARLFYDAGGNHVRRVGVNIDVTEPRMAQRRLADTQAELIHVSRLSSLGALASSLGHELNQPLAAVANYISAARSLLQQGPAESERILEALKLASESLFRAGELIKRLRALASRGVIEPTEVSLTRLLNDTASIALHDNHSPITIDLAIPSAADTVHADPILLQQVLFNLIRNAAEAMCEGGGAITIRASVVSPNMSQVEIRDTGPGLDQDVIADLFTAFVSTKPDGMGVGLSVCRTIVENGGGLIWAESSPNGTSFFLTIPRTQGI